MTRKRISNSERKKRKREKKNSEKSTVFGAFENGQMIEFTDDEDIEIWEEIWKQADKDIKKSDE